MEIDIRMGWTNEYTNDQLQILPWFKTFVLKPKKKNFLNKNIN